MSILGVIPVRYGSTRLPGKPLIQIQGKPMIQHVYERAKQCTRLDRLVIATDDARIADVAHSMGAPLIMTSSSHRNGTERVAEVAKGFQSFEHIINIQGDEPLIDPQHIDQLAEILTNGAEIATLIKKITEENVLHNPSEIKVVIDRQLKALYFSRSPIPYSKASIHEATFYQHIGIYGFKRETLTKIVDLPQTTLEVAESLEQLRWLENGYRIQTGITTKGSKMIDTPEDLAELLKEINNG